LPDSLPETGHAGLDLALEAGPRVVGPDTPEDVLKEIGKYQCFSPFRDAMKRMKLSRRRKLLRLIDRTCKENRIIEKVYQGSTTILPEARIPVDLVYELEAENKEAWNPAMREDTLRCYPGLRINVKP
jgi:hypothetical protein